MKKYWIKPQAARRAANDAIDRVDKHAHERFKLIAFKAGVHLAKTVKVFDSADLRDLMWKHYPEVKTHEDRVLGAIMRQLARAGWVKNTHRMEKSKRVRNHNRPLNQWESLRYEGHEPTARAEAGVPQAQGCGAIPRRT